MNMATAFLTELVRAVNPANRGVLDFLAFEIHFVFVERQFFLELCPFVPLR